jgi:hypothetical protein
MLSIAIQEAKILGYNMQDMKITMYADKKEIEMISDSMEVSSGTHPDLSNRNYALVVFYSTDPNIKDRKLWIYIDKDTSQIIGHLAGQ